MKKKINNKNPEVAINFSLYFSHQQNEIDLERAVIRLRGVISIQTDVEHQRCIVRTTPSIDQYKIAQQIVDNTRMRPRLVAKNKNQQEVGIILRLE
jgi:hypothetical protein